MQTPAQKGFGQSDRVQNEHTVLSIKAISQRRNYHSGGQRAGIRMEVPSRVHIMPVGYERDRVIQAAEMLKSDKTIIIGHKKGDSRGDRLRNEVHEELRMSGVEVSMELTDFFSLYDSIETIGKIISEHKEDDVYVNLSTGGKITAIAGFIATSATEATAYYGRAEKYDDIPTGFTDIQEMPHYPIDLPDREKVIIMGAIRKIAEKDEDPTKGKLIHLSQQNSLEFTTRDVDEKGLYRLLDSEILDPLSDQGYVESYQDGRNVRIRLTETGESAFGAFSALRTPGIDYGTLLDENE